MIDLLMRIFCRPSSAEHIVICPPTYGMYSVTAKVNDVGVVEVPLLPTSFQLDVPAILDAVTPDSKLLFLCSPGNPTARLLNKDDVLHILHSSKYRGMVVVDEASGNASTSYSVVVGVVVVVVVSSVKDAASSCPATLTLIILASTADVMAEANVSDAKTIVMTTLPHSAVTDTICS